jgi:aminoglycoside/choline kinase family phosphotransferase
MLLFEDLGDLRLHDFVRQNKPGPAERRRLYLEVIRELVGMQLRGADNFDTRWCWQTPRYDMQVMLERESGYFQQAFCRDLLGIDPESRELQEECIDIASRAAAAPATFFLHRDLQSRNLMLKGGRVRIIDFQGGRLGPLAYDLASTLIDPYVNLSTEFREQLIDAYIAELNRWLPYDADRFRQEYFYLALQRNLQVLGAFAFLGGQCGKTFFLPYIRPALASLQALLAKSGPRPYHALSGLLARCTEKVQENAI